MGPKQGMNGATRKDQDVLGCMSGTKPDHRSAGTDPDITEPAVKQKKPLRLQIGSIFQALLAAWVASLAILVAGTVDGLRGFVLRTQLVLLQKPKCIFHKSPAVFLRDQYPTLSAKTVCRQHLNV